MDDFSWTVSSTLSAVLKQMSETLIKTSGAPLSSNATTLTMQTLGSSFGLLSLPSWSSDLSNSSYSRPEDLFGLEEKYVAIESVLYLGKQLQKLQDTMEKCSPFAERALIENYFEAVRICSILCILTEFACVM